MSRYLALAPMSLVLVAACASTPGARPHDMSAAQHQATAASEERQAQGHEAQYDPRARAEAQPCGGIGPTPTTSGSCWTDSYNPTEAHALLAAQLRQAAAAHRTASRALRDAEEQACVGLSPDDRDMSPFSHREDIARVEPLYRSLEPEREWYGSRLRGAVITFRAVPGMTAAWLQRVVDCHLARNAVLGHDVPEMSFCPLVPNGVAARVKESNAGLAVSIAADDEDTAREVLRRAQALVSR